MLRGVNPADQATGEALRRLAQSAVKPSEEVRMGRLETSVPELMAMANVPQDPRWHPEGDVLTHSLLAADAAANLWDAEHSLLARREIIVLAALFHDAGKPLTTHTKLGRVVSPGHAEVGERIVIAMGHRLDWPEVMSRAIAGLISNHLVHLSVKGDPTRRAVRRLNERLAAAGTSLEEWSMLVRADGAARGVGSIEDRAEAWLRLSSQL